LLAYDLWEYPNCPALAIVQQTLAGCHAPIHPTLLDPLCVFLGNILHPNLLTTPFHPFPLLTPRISIHY